MSESTVTGIGMPAIEECPECGYDTLHGTTITISGSVLDLDGSGGIARWHDDVLQDTLFMSLDCAKCGEILVEDSEVVHEDIQA